LIFPSRTILSFKFITRHIIRKRDEEKIRRDFNCLIKKAIDRVNVITAAGKMAVDELLFLLV